MKVRIANIISNVFNAYAGLFLATFLVIYTQRVNIPNWQFVLGLSLVFPLVQILLFLKYKLISDLEISNRKERPMFHLFATIPNVVVLIIAINTTSNLFISFTLVCLVINILMGFVSIFWKMSGHLIYLSLAAFTSVFLFHNWFLVAFWVVILPLVAWSRVVLQRHTVLQVIVGGIAGLIIPFLLL